MALELARTVRLCVIPGLTAIDDSPGNTHAGTPALDAVGAFYELTVRCRGDVDPETGYLVDIGAIDRAVRSSARAILAEALAAPPPPSTLSLMPRLLAGIAAVSPGTVYTLTWHLSPFFRVTMEAASMARVLLQQQFDFAASHRLHCPGLSDEQNRAVFGKCNNPNGHGHNYRLDVGVWTTLNDRGEGGLSLRDMERIVHESVINRLDHRHLNLDVPEFARLNPSVENIARVSFDALREPIHAAGGELDAVTVWETERTGATCRG